MATAPRVFVICRAAAAMLMACACARSVPRFDAGVSRVGGWDQAFVRADNLTSADVVVYAFRSHASVRVRLGAVTALGRASFRLPEDFARAGHFGFVLDPVGRTTSWTLDGVRLSGGQQVWVRIADPIAHSTWTVFRPWAD